MKRNLFFIINSIFLFTIIGIGMQSCNDDDDKDDTEPGKKTIEIKVVDEEGQSVIADVTIWKNQDSLTMVQVNGTYTYDVTNEANKTEFDFVARRVGYASSKKESVTLNFSDDSHSWSSSVTLTITKQGASFVVDQSKDETINFSSGMDAQREVSMFIPAGATDLQYLEISPTFVPTAASKGFLSRDAPNGIPAMEILSIKTDWSGNFKDGKKVKLTFPLSRGFVSAAELHNLALAFGTNDTPTGTWESYPVTIDDRTLTGTVEIPHFSTWYLTLGNEVIFTETNSPIQTLGTSACGQPITVNYNQPNPQLSQLYLDIFGLKELSAITQSHTAAAVPNMQVTVRAYCSETDVNISGKGLSFVYFQPPVVFSTSVSDCGSHVGGGGQ